MTKIDQVFMVSPGDCGGREEGFEADTASDIPEQGSVAEATGGTEEGDG